METKSYLEEISLILARASSKLASTCALFISYAFGRVNSAIQPETIRPSYYSIYEYYTTHHTHSRRRTSTCGVFQSYVAFIHIDSTYILLKLTINYDGCTIQLLLFIYLLIIHLFFIYLYVYITFI